jgi:hypothetical protein
MTVDVGMKESLAVAILARACRAVTVTVAAIAAVVSAACANGSTENPNAPAASAPGASGCDTGKTSCSDGCVSLLEDGANCGTCGHVCPGSESCNSGKCIRGGSGGDAGSLSCTAGRSHCGATCADTQNDPAHCGSCANSCPSGMGCQGGACTTTCSSSQIKCGASCHDVSSDALHCGSCSNACASTQACKGGVCCGATESACGATCVDLSSSADNCGACGARCTGAAPFCAEGVCKACNAAVLLLGDESTAGNQALAAALTSAGLHVTTVDNGATQYAGSPAASAFGVVIVSDGLTPADMPVLGQSAIVSAQQGGAGVVLTEWAAYEVSLGAWTALSQIVLLQRDSGNTGTLTFALESVGHPIWAGLPASFTTASAMGSNVGATLKNGGTRIAGCTQCGGAGVVVKDEAGGRVVQIAHAANYGSGAQAWTSDANIRQMMVNAVRWASRCQ